jgi:Transposase DDE domain
MMGKIGKRNRWRAISQWNAYKTSQLYPDHLRRISFYDLENDRRFVFLTNNFSLSALTIAELYKSRWQIEMFFKWIKQNLHIKSFYGTSDNAVKIQIWIAISIYVLVAIVNKELGLESSLSEILQILSLTLFKKIPIFQTLSAQNSQDQELCFSNQLPLIDLRPNSYEGLLVSSTAIFNISCSISFAFSS